jgi:Fe2+ or Zn2+ uptake regulation protein
MSVRSERIGRLLNAKGYSLTPGRRIVLESIADCDSVFTANDVCSWVDSVDPSLGRATVFRTLDLLSQVGVLSRVHNDDGCHGYTICDDGHHHHLVCRQCGKVVSLENCNVVPELERAAGSHGFAVESHRLEVFGICSNCQAENAGRREKVVATV